MAEYGENKIFKANGELCRIKDLNVGDYIFDAFGYPTEIIGIVKKRAILWKLHLLTRTDIYTDAKHEWFCIDFMKKKITVPMDKLSFVKKFDQNYFGCYIIKYPVEYTEIPLNYDPYKCSVLSRSANNSNGLMYLKKYNIDLLEKLFGEEYIIKKNKRGYFFTKNGKMVKWHDNIFKKFIPNEILHNSLKVRIAYVQGILDTCGAIKRDKSAWQLKIKDRNYAHQVRELLFSVGLDNSIVYKKEGTTLVNIYSRRPRKWCKNKESYRYFCKFSFDLGTKFSSVKQTNIEADVYQIITEAGHYKTTNYVSTKG